MKVYIVEDQDTGDNASSIVKLFLEREAAERWMAAHADEAFGYYKLAMGLDFEESFEVVGLDELIAQRELDAMDEEAMGEDQ
jgi:hypothetical protein